MTTLWEHLKKGIKEGFQTASDLTSEYSKIGRIKLDTLGVKKELEEKMIELGGRIYDLVATEGKRKIKLDQQMEQLVEDIRRLEKEMKELQAEAENLKMNDERKGSS